MTFTRRTLLEGAAALSAQVLFARRLPSFAGAQASARKAAAPPGALELVLTSLSSNILRISISPANDGPHLAELGVVAKEGKLLAGPGPVHSGDVTWGKYSLKITENPLHIAAWDNGKLKQEVRFDLDSTDVRFN
ncbi:MAG TPA: hypothetical protein VGN16_13925, partial [Acidobacteriaceae bacterium]